MDEDVIETWLRDVWPSIRQGYTDDEIYNADESGLFLRFCQIGLSAEKGNAVLEANCRRSV